MTDLPTTSFLLHAAVVLLVAMSASLAVVSEGLATQTWCATVKRNVPDGHLNLRGGLGAKYPLLARLSPGEYIELDTGLCGQTFAEDWKKLEHACTPDDSKWSFVEHAPRMGVRDRGGWVNTRYLEQARCQWNN